MKWSGQWRGVVSRVEWLVDRSGLLLEVVSLLKWSVDRSDLLAGEVS